MSSATTLAELLAGLREAGVRIRSEGGQLRVSAADGALTPQMKADLAAHKSELLELLGAAPADGAVPPLTRVVGDGPAPLSFAQERVWMFQRMAPADSTYNITVHVRLHGQVDVAVLEGCLQELVARHEPLRSTFELRSEGPVQVVMPPPPVKLAITDLGSLSEADQQAERQRVHRAEQAGIFDLEADLLLRARLVRYADDRHELLLTTHHVAADGTSIVVMLNDLAALYRRALGEDVVPLAQPAVRYRDYACWQRSRDEQGGYDALLDHWATRLEGAPPTLDLATDAPRSGTQTFAGGSVFATLDADVVAGLGKLARDEGATPFVVLLAAFYALLYRNTGAGDIVVGTPVHGRDSASLRDLVGMFVNTLPLRVGLQGDPTLRELVHRVRDRTFEAFAHDALPFAKLVDRLSPERDLGSTPVFQVMFNMFSEAVSSDIELPELRIELPSTAELMAEIDVPSKFDLTLYAREEADETHLNLVYNADLFDGGRMREMLDQLQILARAIALDPDSRVSAVDLAAACGDDDLVAARALARRHPEDHPPIQAGGSIVDRLDEMVAVQAERIAVADGEHELTYGALGESATVLAGAIANATDGAVERVGLLLGTGASFVTGAFGTLISGAAFVPLEPTYPTARLRQLFAASGASVIVTDREGIAIAAEIVGDSGVAIDIDAVLAGEASEGRPPSAPPRPTAEEAAYLLYTSGSTGTPKAVAQSHRTVLHHARNHGVSLGIAPGDRLGWLATPSHDAAMVDIFGALMNGATLCPMDVRRHGLAGVSAAIDRLGITVYHSTPTVLQALVDEAADDDFGSVRLVVLGGEPVTRAHIEAFRSHFPADCMLVNGYGATECSWVSHCVAGPGTAFAGATMPVGRALPGIEVSFLDESGELNPVGGEIVLRSEFLPPGYENDAEATSAAFLADPDGTGTLYRTGDLGARRPDGTIVFVGRADRQLKVRGFRVEPGEVEAVMEGYEGVAEAAVDLREDGDGTALLVGYCVAGGSLEVAALRRYLQERLPSYMVPGAIVPVVELPRTRSGKLDRRQLPAPGESTAAAESFVAPRDEVEEALAGIWREVLCVERVGVNDNFFAIGGNSLKAAQVAGRVRDRLGVEVPLRDFFLAPTLADVADSMRSGSGGPADAVDIPRIDRAGPLELSFSQERMWLLQQLAPRSAAYNLGGTMRLRGRVDVEVLRRSFEHIVERHEVLRTTFLTESGRPVQRIDAAATAELRCHDLRDLPRDERGEESRRLAAETVDSLFDLERDAPIRLSLVRTADDEYLLTLCMHHIAGDLWSMGVFTREFVDCYQAFAAGREPELEPLAVQYCDYAAWHRRRLDGPRLEAHIDYWREALDGARPLDLPTDRPRPMFQTFAGDRVRTRLPAEGGAALNDFCVKESATPFMTLLACFNVLLSRYSGQTDISVGVPIANRANLATEALIGPFVNTLVHRNDLSEDPSLRELLAGVREVALAALAHQELPFERLVEELAVDRDTSRSPLFQVLFNVVDTPRLEPAALSGAVASPVDLNRRGAQFDLVLNIMREQDEYACELSFNTDLFDRSTADRLLRHYVRLVESAVRAPDVRVSALPMMSEAEVARVGGEWNDTAVDCPDAGYVTLFQQQVERSPDAVAATCGAESLTYAELNERCNRLAARLRARGIGAGDVVGAATARGLEMLVALLAIQKAGAAYLPLDPGYPEQRIAFMVEDSGARVVIADGATTGRLPSGLGQVVRVDDPTLSEEPADDPLDLPGAEDLAYVMYTSGSTGKPKGVQIAHRSLVNFLHSMRREPGLNAEDVLLSVTTMSFDISCLELYLPLLVGARVVIARREQAEDGYRLAELLQECDATVMQATPATWQLLINTRWEGQRSLKVLSGGEALSRELADELLGRCGEVWNMYGPTETTIWSTVHRVAADDEPVPIGRPIANTRVYVLDDARRIQPIGIPGELYIGGTGVAVGYLGRPELTAERFIDDPFCADGKLYRTGDLARFRQDGLLEHLGRVDHQVKIRGHRVELGEIESVLCAARQIREAVAVVRDARVVAYVVFAEGVDLTPMEVRDIAAELLPAHMVPGLVVALDKLPLTPNGKVDRKALPEPFQRSAMAAGQYVSPETETERLVADIWRDLLSVERVGSADQFFALGGHSLLAMQAVMRIEESTGRRIDPRLMFFQNLKQIANVVERSVADGSQLEV